MSEDQDMTICQECGADFKTDDAIQCQSCGLEPLCRDCSLTTHTDVNGNTCYGEL